MDSETFFVLLLFVVFIGVFALLILWSIKSERKRQEALTALAAEHGWTYDNQRGSGRKKPSRFTMTPSGGGEHWQLAVTRRRSGGGGKGSSRTSHPGSTEFHAPGPVFQGGLAVFMAEMPKGLTGAASSLLGMFDNAIGRSLISHAVGPQIAAHLGALQSFEAPPQTRLTIMATADPALWFDAAAIAAQIHSWHPQTGANRAPPTVMIGSEGVTVRLNYEVLAPELIAQFVALGRALETTAPRAR